MRFLQNQPKIYKSYNGLSTRNFAVSQHQDIKSLTACQINQEGAAATNVANAYRPAKHSMI
jgi:hypothetical protein